MNAANDNLKEVETLTVRVLDDLHNQEDMDRLSILLNESPEARTRYAELVIQDSMLHWETSEVFEFEQPTVKILSFPRLPMVASFAAAIIAICSVWILNNDPPVVTGVATLRPDDPSKELQSSNLPNTITSSSHLDDSLALGTLGMPSLEIEGNSPFVRSTEARDEVRRGIMILKENKRFAEGGLVQFHDDIVAWNREEHLSVPTEQGILPLEGDRMIKLSTLSIDVRTQSAESSETVRILDLREMTRGKEDMSVWLNTSVYFNQGVGIAHGITEFSLTLHAIQSSNGEPNRSIGHKESRISSDLNPATWEELNSEFEVPKGTDYLVVALNARKEGSQALLPDFGGHYADQLSLNLVLGDQANIPL